ncbi:hypothetical protein OE766_17630 [Pararhizobium sp. YC-54]|uniref:hypothetical protein n=1 Tax=Pararhizobium sp. YC-54 TaxID=2986920 RepID=UPI0021F72ED8|nr:hypothetical protein [Pararhizobium sp. YC-54]MCW0000062.1 hypothetical protein [Pararhizobium sp. YC-54]
MTIYYLFSVFALLAAAWLIRAAMAGHRDAMQQRGRLLDEAHGLLGEPGMILAPDRFPIVTGRIGDGRHVKIELIADTMVTRRLPQLWLKVTLFESMARDCPSLGVLARPTGSEYYSLVHGFPEWMTPPEMGMSSLMRGDGRATVEQTAIAGRHFQRLFADQRVKEAVMTSKATRLVYQASQGERAAHMFLRQARFPLDRIPAATIGQAIALTAGLSTIYAEADRPPVAKVA